MSPYRISEAPINECRKELDKILERCMGEGKILTFRTVFSDKLRYKLHEAINAAKALDIQPYADIHVTLHVRGLHVHVTPKAEAVMNDVTIVEDTESHTALPEALVSQVHSIFGVIGEVMSHPGAIEIHFPKFESDLSPIVAWVKNNEGYEIIEEPILIIRKIKK